MAWPRLLDQNEFEALTEADSRLTSRRSNYRIFIRTHSPDGQLLYCRVKANPIRCRAREKGMRERERERERGRERERRGQSRKSKRAVLNAPRDLAGRFPRPRLQSAPARKITPRQLSPRRPVIGRAPCSRQGNRSATVISRFYPFRCCKRFHDSLTGGGWGRIFAVFLLFSIALLSAFGTCLKRGI